MICNNPRVDEFMERQGKWRDEFGKLRRIVLESGLDEEFKWGHPCYTSGGKNIVLIHGFKEYCALLFFKGSLMADPHGILVQQTENVQAARQIRFTGMDEISRLEPFLASYVDAAVEIERSGRKIRHKDTDEYEVPREFQERLDEDQVLKTAFEALTPGRQRAYLFYFSSAKRPETRTARMEKYIPQILEGRGLND